MPVLSLLAALLWPATSLAVPDRPDRAGRSSSVAAATTPGIDLAAMDRSVAAGEDFYRFANGRWLETTRIPPDRSRWGNFDRLSEQVDLQIRGLLERESASGGAGIDSDDAARAREYYRSFLDQARIESEGLAPLQDELAAIDRIEDPAALADALGASLGADVDPLNNTRFATSNLFGIWVAPGLHDSQHLLPYLLQGGLSLPDREYYLSPSPRMGAIRERFRRHAARMFALAGLDQAEERATAVLELERKLAEGHVSRSESEDVTRATEVWSRSDFASKAPGLDWPRLLQAAGLGAQQRIAIWHPQALVHSARLAGEVPLAVWRDWLRLHLLDACAEVLPHAFAKEAFAMYGTTLSGVPHQGERWKLALASTSALLPDAVGRLYVQRYFPTSSQRRVQAMVKRIIDAFDQRITRLEWMSPGARAEAREKLRTLYVGIGFPEHWKSYRDLEVRSGDALGNLLRGRRHQRAQQLARLDGPVERGEWCMPAQLVNAVNLPLQNALNFPAAILQPPFFDPGASDAYNYGAIGSTIGHEISHSFDDEGALFDAHGELRNWWSAQDLAHFKAASASLVRQFSAYRPLADARVNGELTLSENIADVAGLAAAYDAMHATSGESAREARSGGYDEDQTFFIAYAQNFRSLQREQLLRQSLVVDGHAPAACRAATVRNLDAWYRAFGVRRRQGMYLAPHDRTVVW